jgi:hypothetical protein
MNQIMSRINGLTEKISKDASLTEDEKRNTLESIDRFTERAAAYFVSVVDHTAFSLRSEALRPQDTEAYAHSLNDLDQKRHGCHEDLINSINVINRIASGYGMDKVFDTGLDRILYAEADPENGITDADAAEDHDRAAFICYSFCMDI